MACIEDLTELDLNLNEPNQFNLTTTSSSTTISLFPFISFNKSFGLNLSSTANDLKKLLRPLDSKDLILLPEESEDGIGLILESQENCQDDELILHINFTELVKIKSILIGTGGGLSSESPRKVKVWTNKPNGISFNDIDLEQSDQDWNLLESTSGQGRGSVEYPVRISKFNNCQSLDLFFSDTRSGTQTRLYYLGFKGEVKALKKDPRTDLTVAAEQGMGSLVDSIKEKSGNNLASVR